MSMRIVWMLYVLLAFSLKGHSSPTFDPLAFSNLSKEQRYLWLHNVPFEEMDSSKVARILDQALPILVEKKDHRSLLVWSYYKFLTRGKLKLTYSEIIALLSDLEQNATLWHFEVEKIVAHHYKVFEEYNAKKLPHEQLYLESLRTFAAMEKFGFQYFTDYNLPAILCHLASVFTAIDDTEAALTYYRVAEKYIEPTQQGEAIYTRVLNNLAAIYKERKQFSEGITCCKKIIALHQKLNPTNDRSKWRNRFWVGLASLDIAEMLIDRGDLSEGERYATAGYEISRSDGFTEVEAEYDALLVLISIKLKLKKYAEVPPLFERIEILKSRLDSNPKLSQLKHRRLYGLFAEYYESVGNYAKAFDYTRQYHELQDSLTSKNNLHKFDKLMLKHEAETYEEKISKIEGEKRYQRWLLYTVCIIASLLLGIAIYAYQRIQRRRKKAVLALKLATEDLKAYTHSLVEKSTLVDELKQELDRLSNPATPDEHIEKLLQSTILTEEEWKQFRGLFEKVHPNFISSLRAEQPELTSSEVRLIVLEKLNLSTAEIASMLGVSRNTINQTRSRLRKKVNKV